MLSRGPSPPPPLDARPPRLVTSGLSGPAPGRPGTNPQRMQNLGVGGEGWSRARAEGVPGRSSDWKEEEGASGLLSLSPRLRGTPLFPSLSSDD